MIKALKVIFLMIAGLLVITVIGLTVFLAIFDISRYKPRITQELSRLLSRKVDIEQMRLDFKAGRGLTITVKGLSIADDPAFSGENLLAADLIYLTADILALVSHGQIVIATIEIVGPHIHLVRNKEGVFNVQTLLRKDDRAHIPQGSQTLDFGPVSAKVFSDNGRERGRERKEEDAVAKMLINSVSIANGVLTVVDNTFEPPWVVPLRQIDFHAAHVSLQKPFLFELQAMLWADQPNIALNGEIAIDARNSQVNLQRVRMETDLSRLRLRTMPFYSILKEELLLEGDINGTLAMRDGAMRIGQEGLVAFSIDGELTNGRIRTELLEQPFEDIHGRFHANESNIDMSELSFSHSLGTVTAQGRWSDYRESSMLMFDLHIDGVQLRELIPRSKMPVLDDSGRPLGLEGEIYAGLDTEGYGAQILETLKGDGSVEIRGGKLFNINLLRFVLDKLSFIPDIVQRIEENLPQRYKDGLQSGETSLGRVVSTAQLKDRTLFWNAEVEAEAFTVIAGGNLDFDQNFALTADFYISEDLSRSMTASVPELSYLRDSNGRIHIPFKPYQGKLQDIRIYPDVEELGKKVIQNRGREELKKVIFKALDIEENPAPDGQAQDPPSPQGTQGESPQEQDVRPEKVLIDGIFDAIFKGNEAP